MELKIESKEDWEILNVFGNIDSVHYSKLTEEIDRLISKGKVKIALNLGQTRFLSLPAIRFLNTKARELKGLGGLLVLVEPTIKTRRHIEIFSCLDDFQIYEKADDFNILTTEAS